MFGTTYTGGMSYRSASEINSAMGRVYGHMSLAVIVSLIALCNAAKSILS